MTRFARTLAAALCAGSSALAAACAGPGTAAGAAAGAPAGSGAELARAGGERDGEARSERSADLGPVPASLAQSLAEARATRRADDFALLDAEGLFFRLHEQDLARAVVLVSFALGCDESLRAAGAAGELARRFGERGARVFLLDAQPGDDRARVLEAMETYGIATPVLQDETQLAALGLGLERAGEALVIDPRDWGIVWRGRAATDGGESGLEGALAELLAGRRPAADGAPARGVPIQWRAALAQAPDFARVQPILVQRCVPCHSQGGIAPWAMSSFERVRGWAPMIRETVRTRRMPPWHADPHVGTFANDRSLSLDETDLLVRWIDGGTPRGEGRDELPERSTAPRPEWHLGEPDLVVRAPAQELPAAGVIPYRYAYVEVELERDVWVAAAQVKPSNPRVLHHSLIFLEYPDELAEEQPVFDTGSAFAFFVPGTDPEPFPPDSGKLLPKGSTVVFQLHYTTTGKPETDSPELGLYFLDEPPRFELESTSAIQWNLRIPPGAPAHEVWAYHVFDEDVLLWSMSPHMHYRGTAMTYGAVFPDESKRVLLSIPRYDFNWQGTYRLKEPLLLPRGTTVLCRAIYDNSAHNPANPDPTREVTWGIQSYDEMLIGNMDVHPAPAEHGERGERAGRR